MDVTGAAMGPNQAKWCLGHIFDGACSGAFVASRRAEKKAAALIGQYGEQKANAFLHSYWMAIVTYYYGARAARSLGRAHEKDGGESPEDTAKDLQNNERGIVVGSNASSVQDIEDILLWDMNNGYLKCLSGKDIVTC